VTVKFLDGSVVGADTSERNLEDLAGLGARAHGRITEAQLQEALRIQKGSLQRLGYILVQAAFHLGHGPRGFAAHPSHTDGLSGSSGGAPASTSSPSMDQMEYDSEHFRPSSAETILMEGARMIDEWPMLERRIKSPTMVFKQTEPERLSTCRFSPS
jgi:hypothetical protein